MINLRMYWACTHTMLKLTEIPIFISLGVEIIPEEVIPSLLPDIEGMVYDDPEDKINKMWMQKTTIPPLYLKIVRRARLWDRKGIISREEQEVFNSYFDIIYVPTNFVMAQNIAKWFKGEVIFRYFGDLHGYSEKDWFRMGIDKGVYKRIIIAPIFNVLGEQKFVQSFARCSFLHNYLNEDIVPTKYIGWREKQPISIVCSNINHPENQGLIKSLIPLASKVPVQILGKNFLDAITSHIKNIFHVTGVLPRDEYFKQFFSSRLLVYPNSRRYHSNNVHLEAIYGGMPVLFRAQNPLLIENSLVLSDKLIPSKIGSVRTTNELIERAIDIYQNKDKLEQLIINQKVLLSAYSKERVLAEAHSLMSMCKINKSKNNTIATKSDFILSQTPNAVFYEVHKNFPISEIKVPFYHFILDLSLNNVTKVCFKNNTVYALEIYHSEQFLQYAIGVVETCKRAPFAPNLEHVIGLEGFIEKNATGEIKFDIFYGDSCVDSHGFKVLSTTKDVSHFKIKTSFNYPQAFHIVVYIRNQSTGKFYILNLLHNFVHGDYSQTPNVNPDKVLSRTLYTKRILYALIKNSHIKKFYYRLPYRLKTFIKRQLLKLGL